MKSIKGKKLVIFDLDGTLAQSKQAMSPSMSTLIQSLIQHIKVAIISGGGFPQFQKQFLATFDAHAPGLSNLYLLPTSGTRCMTWNKDWQEKYAENLTEKEKKSVYAAFEYAMHAVKYAQPAKTYGEVIEDRGSQITFSALGQNAPLAEKEKWDPDRSKRQALISALQTKIPEFDIRIGGTNSIDITRKGVNKAYGIHKLEHLLKIPIKDMLFVGDALFFGGNDFPAKSTGVDCIEVSGPEETEKVIRSWIS